MTKKRTTKQQIKDLMNQLLEVTQQLNSLKLQVWKERVEAQAARRTSLADNNRSGLQIKDRAIILKNY